MDHFLSIFQICYSIASVLCFGFWATRQVGSSLPDQGSHQSMLKEINPEYTLEGLMLKLKLQYFGHLMQKTDSLEKTELRKIEGRKRSVDREEIVGYHQGLEEQEFESTLGVSERQGSLVCCSSWGHKESDTTEQLN